MADGARGAGRRIVAIIPARGGSKRLPRKNIHPVLGAPMIAWVIRACQESSHDIQVYVSTEDAEIAKTARSYGANVIRRPPALADDAAQKQDVIVDACGQLSAAGESFDIVISAQPNSPELRAEDLDAAIDKFLTHQRWEIFSVDRDLLQNGAFRILRPEAVMLKTLSVHSGVLVTDYVDVHTLEDVRLAESRLKGRTPPEQVVRDRGAKVGGGGR